MINIKLGILIEWSIIIEKIKYPVDGIKMSKHTDVKIIFNKLE